MPFASLSPEVRALSIMRELSIGNAYVSALTGIEETKLGKALRQIRELPGPDGAHLISTLHRLVELRDAILPFCLDVKNPTNAQLLLDAFEGLSGEEIQKRVTAIFFGGQQ